MMESLISQHIQGWQEFTDTEQRAELAVALGAKQ
jgi:hypothetical protein